MNATTKNLLKKYSQLPGSQKVRIAMELSDLARKVRQKGALATQGNNPTWHPASKNFL